MKNRKLYLIVFILFLYFSFVLHIPQNLFNEQDDKDNRNIVTPLSASNSVVQEWNRTWGTSATDVATQVALDSSDNIYLAGATDSYGEGSLDIVLVKYNSFGEYQWNRTWGGIATDMGLGVAVDSSDNVYLAGYTYSFGAGDNDMVLVKYDSSGVQQWNRTWGGIMGDIGYGVVIDSSENVYLSGVTSNFGAGSSDMVLVKYDSSSVQQWNRTWGGSSVDIAMKVTIDSSDNVYLTGHTNSSGAGMYDIVMVKYDSSGVQQWNRTWGGNMDDYGFGIVVDSLDNVYLSGYTNSLGAGSFDTVLVKYDSSGVQQWNRTWGGIMDDFGYGVAVDSSDNVYLTGYTNSSGAGMYDMIMVKYDGSGELQWDTTWGGNNSDKASGIAVDSLDNIYLAGFTHSFGEGATDMALVKFGRAEGKKERKIHGFSILFFISAIGVLTALNLKKKLK